MVSAARLRRSGSGGQRLTLPRCRRTSAFGREAGGRRRSSSDVNGSSLLSARWHVSSEPYRRDIAVHGLHAMLPRVSIVGTTDKNYSAVRRTRCSSEMIRMEQVLERFREAAQDLSAAGLPI